MSIDPRSAEWETTDRDHQTFTAADLDQLRADYACRRRTLTFAETDAMRLLQEFAKRHGVVLEVVILALMDQDR